MNIMLRETKPSGTLKVQRNIIFDHQTLQIYVLPIVSLGGHRARSVSIQNCGKPY